MSFKKALLLVCLPAVALIVFLNAVTGAQNKPDPLVTDGLWSVPDDIGYGTYRTIPARPGILESGYWELCSDYVCESRYDRDGNFSDSRIDNGIVAFPGTLTVTEQTKFVRVERVYLKPIP